MPSTSTNNHRDDVFARFITGDDVAIESIPIFYQAEGSVWGPLPESWMAMFLTLRGPTGCRRFAAPMTEISNKGLFAAGEEGGGQAAGRLAAGVGAEVGPEHEGWGACG